MLAPMDQRRVYEERAEHYDRLVSAEDHDGNLVAALRDLAPFVGARVLDVGAGTGRMSRIALALGAGELTLVEPAPAMLDVARARLRGAPATFVEAPADAIPLEDASRDIALAGWVFGHLRHWFEDDWKARIDAALREVRRVLRPGGTFLLIETMGTMTADAGPPNAALAEYYRWLEAEQGFARPRVVRTDYVFASAEEAAAVLEGFFGPSMGERVRDAGAARVPESTAVWRGTA